MATALLLRRSLQSLNNTLESSIQRYHSALAGKPGKTFPQRFSDKEVHSAEMAIKTMVRYKSEFVRRIEDEDVLNSKTASSGKRESRRGKSEMNNSDCGGYSSDFHSHKDGASNCDPEALGGSSSDVHGASHGGFNPSDGSCYNHIDIVGSHSSDGGSNNFDIVGSGSGDGGSSGGGSSCGGGCGGGG